MVWTTLGLRTAKEQNRTDEVEAPDQELDQRGHGEVVEKDCKARNLNREDAMDHGRWKKLIKTG